MMNEQQINDTTVINREINGIVGGRTNLRLINPSDPKDVSRVFQIEKSKGMVEHIAEAKDLEPNRIQMARWIKDMNERRSVQIFAVTADKTVRPYDHGEVEGWLRLDGENSKEGSEEKKRYERVLGTTLVDSSPIPYEIAYIKRPKIPGRGNAPDLITDAVIQACHMVASQDAEKEKRYKPTKKDGVIKPRRVIMAFIDKNNPQSTEVLKRAGFDLVKESVSWDADDPPDKDMHVLNWDSYHKIMEKKESLLLDKLRNLFPEKFPVKPDIIKSNKPPNFLRNSLHKP